MPQAAIRLAGTLHHSPARLSQSTAAPGPSPTPASWKIVPLARIVRSRIFKTAKIPIPQVQPAAPPANFSSGAPRIVQADRFFNDDSHAFNNPNRAETHAGRALTQFSAKRNSKNVRTFATSSLLRTSPTLLSLWKRCRAIGNTAFTFFLTDNNLS